MKSAYQILVVKPNQILSGDQMRRMRLWGGMWQVWGVVRRIQGFGGET